MTHKRLVTTVTPRRKILTVNRWTTTVFAFLLLAVAPVLGKTATPPLSTIDGADKKTVGYVNGRYWQTLDPMEKVVFIEGYGEAINAAGSKREELMFPWLPTTFGDIEKGLNRFYQEPENLMFPVSFALH